MKKASKFEKIAARCWNLLNEGKPFTPIFATGSIIIYSLFFGINGDFQVNLISYLILIPLLALFFKYDYPLFLRNYLWMPLIGFIVAFDFFDIYLSLFAICLYFFFTVIFWGTIYYYLRIGTTLLNFTRFWKLVLKNSDSTSGNAQEQLPKFLLILNVWSYNVNLSGKKEILISENLLKIGVLYLSILLFSWILHRYLFDWKPEMYTTLTEKPDIEFKQSNKVYVLVIDGMRKDRFDIANTPFLDKMRKMGTQYTNMETLYPARTVVCFTSMFTGTYPHEHGITSNMVWKLGIKTESVFDSLRKVNKSSKLLGIAHLYDSFGHDVETVTAVMKNDVADRNILERAKKTVINEDPDLFIVQFIGTDQTGHSRGTLYTEYLDKINEADSLVEEFYNFLADRNQVENSTFIICADHGQADGIGGHGHLDEGERFVPYFMFGHSIKEGVTVEDKHSLVSMTPTICEILGAPYPSHSRGKVLLEALKQKGE